MSLVTWFYWKDCAKQNSTKYTFSEIHFHLVLFLLIKQDHELNKRRMTNKANYNYFFLKATNKVFFLMITWNCKEVLFYFYSSWLLSHNHWSATQRPSGRTRHTSCHHGWKKKTDAAADIVTLETRTRVKGHSRTSQSPRAPEAFDGHRNSTQSAVYI